MNHNDLVRRMTDAVAAHPLDGGPLVMVLVGAGGIGKRALALQFLHRHLLPAHPDRFPGGALQEDLTGDGTRLAREPGAVLEDWLNAWGETGIPAELEGKSARFRSRSAQQPVVVLLRNAAHAVTVRHLLPASAASVVVVTTTSRAVAAGLRTSPGARVEQVSLLDSQAAYSLLRTRLFGSEPDWLGEAKLRRAADACEGHPLALTLVATRLAEDGPDWAADTLESLADERRRLEVMAVPDDLSVRAALDVSYRRLPARLQELFRALGVLPTPVFDAPAALDVAGDSPTRTLADLRADLAQLASESLLERAAGGRYRMHGLLQVRARELAQADGNQVIQARRARLATGVLARAEAASSAVSGRFRYRTAPVDLAFDNEATALDALDADRPLLLATVRSAAELGIPEAACRAFQTLHELVQHRGVADEVLSVLPAALDAARATGDLLWSARLHYEAGFVHLERDATGDGEAAGRHFAEALRFASAASPPHARTRSTALECLGMVARSRGDAGEARRYFLAALDALQGVDHPRGVAILHLHLGRAYLAEGDHAGARRTFDNALTLVAAIPDPARSGTTRIDRFNRAKLARVDLADAAPDRAAERLTEALDLMRAHQSWANAGDIALYFGRVRQAHGDAVGARALVQEALGLFERAGSRRADAARSVLGELG
ncbi:MAG: tetratricopeptide repeat protein [Streptomycetaceae bacterium]|nr:tetratricopeptide repeat protein [Streptomycetaceae bacterium]